MALVAVDQVPCMVAVEAITEVRLPDRSFRSGQIVSPVALKAIRPIGGSMVALREIDVRMWLNRISEISIILRRIVRGPGAEIIVGGPMAGKAGHGCVIESGLDSPVPWIGWLQAEGLEAFARSHPGSRRSESL
jgi:hypothetical protein